MKKVKLIAVLFLMIILKTADAQEAHYEQDVLRYSFTNLTGTARSMACGNAFGALGADYSGIVTNPAGLARYRNSELGFTTSFNNTKSNAFYIDNTMSDSKFNINFNNLGLAVAIPTDKKEGWRFVNFGFGINRIANFNRSITLEGINKKSSIVQHFEQSANGIDTGNLSPISGAYLAWAQYLIDNRSTSANQYYSDFTYDSSYTLHQRNSIEQDGGMNDISFTLSGNYDDKVYLGGSINVYHVKFSEKNTFVENVLDNSVDYYQNSTYITNLTTKGYGVGAKFGAIFLPTKEIRLGIAYHTPSRIYLEDNYSSVLSSQISNYKDQVSSPDGTYNYSITIPGRIALSAAYIFQKNGFISIDFERVDYRNGKITASSSNSSPLDTFTFDANSKVQNQYRAANNIRIGAEYLIQKVYALRAGVGFIGSPYNNTDNGPSNFKTTIPFISCGFGIRNGNFFFDLALIRNYATNYYAPYTVESEPNRPIKYYTSEIQNVTTNFAVSIGIKF